MSPAYFFDRMTFSECAAFLRGMSRKDKDELANTRLIMWSVLQSQCRHTLELEDIMKLDDEEIPKSNNESELKELRERARKFKL